MLDISHCLICQETIKKGALKCTHCESFQDWRRHISVNTNVLAFVVSLLSLATALAAITQSIPEKPTGEETKFGWISSQASNLRVWAVNEGDKSAILSADGVLKVTSANEPIQTHKAITHPNNDSDGSYYIISPGHEKTFRIQWNGIRPEQVTCKEEQTVSLEVTITDSNGNSRQIQLPFAPLN